MPKSPSPSLRRDLRFEAVFERWNLNFELVELNLTDELRVLDQAQVRNLTDIAPSARVAEYAMQMKNGAPFPPICAAERLEGATDVLIDGNTRARAAKANKMTTFPCYRVSPISDSGFAKLLGGALNQTGGARLEPEAARNAAEVGIDMGWTDETIAREIGYSAESVRRWRRELAFTDRAERLDISEETLNKLNKTQRAELAKVTHDAPFKKLAELTAETGPPAPEFKAVIDAIKKAGSDAEAMAVIDAAEPEWEPVGPPPKHVVRNKIAQQARMHLGGLLAITNSAALFDAGKWEADLEKWRKVRLMCDDVITMFEQQGGGSPLPDPE